MKKTNFKRGLGELIGMAVTLPMILSLVFLMINLFQISQCEQRLIYASYFCGRTAAVSYDIQTAKDNVDKVLGELNAKDGTNISCDALEVHGNWIKGNFVVVKVHEELHPILGIGGGTHYRRIAMMIEHSKWIVE